MKRAILLLFIAFPAFSQTARFPGAIAADKDLTVQKDKAQSTITGAMNASQTSITVVTGSKFTAGMLVTLDNEQALVCSVVGNTVNIGYASCPNVDGRGYAGTVAASHVNGSLISGNIVAWSHNSLASEVKAIETALGVGLSSIPTVAYPVALDKGGTNATTAAGARTSLSAAKSGANSDITSLSALSTPLSVPQGGTGLATGTQLHTLRIKPNAGNNTTAEFTAPAEYKTSSFDFAVQTPGGSLSAGSNSITLSPVPLGVNGADGNHYLYISGGTGTAEAVLITGGTAVSGTASGTVIVTCANTHSGAWTVRSASGGIAEGAIYLVGAGTGGTLVVDAMTTVRQKIQIPNASSEMSLTIRGNGPGGGQIIRDQSYANGDIFYFTSVGGAWPSITLRDLEIESAPYNATWVSTSGAAVHFYAYSYVPALVSNLRIHNAYQSVLIEGSQQITVEGGYFGWHADVMNATTPRAGIEVKRGAAGGLPSYIVIDRVRIAGIYSASRANVDYGILISASDGLQLSNSLIAQVNQGIFLMDEAFFVQMTNNTVDYLETPLTLDASTGPLMGPITVAGNWFGAVAASASPAGPTSTMVSAVEIIATSATAGASVKFTLSGNIISGGGIYGVRVVGANVFGGSITGNLIVGNNSRNQGTGSGIGIGQGADNLVISGNVIKDIGAAVGYQKYGIYVADAGSTNLAITGNSMGGNLTSSFRWDAYPTDSVVAMNAGVADAIPSLGSLANSTNYIASEIGANNAIAGALPNVTLAAGLQVTVKLAHTLQAGANTFALNGGAAVAIKSARNVANNIATAYAATGTVTLLYDGTRWVDVSQ